MDWSGHAARAYITAIAACAALGLAVQSCGVMTSGDDCAARATCTNDGGGSSSGSGEDGAEGATAEAGDDASDVTSQGEVASEDVTSDNSATADVTGDNPATGDVTSEDVGSRGDVGSADVTSEDSAVRDAASEDATIGPDASADVVSEDSTIVDVAIDEAAPPPVDVCVPTTATENCTDGLDDDCNGLIDCAEAACQTAGYTCTAPAPSGWTGPALLWTGAFGSAAPSCPTGYQDAVDAHAGPTGSADTCSCNCNAAGQTCSATGTFMSQSACQVSSACSTVTVTSNGSCATVSATTNCGSAGSFGAPTPTPAGGSCTPQVTTTQGSTASWTTSVRVCSWAGPVDTPGGCSTPGEQCLLGPTSGFGPTLCVFQSGAQTCPAAYPNTTVLYSGESDGRGCGSCTCSATPSGGSCSGTISLYGTNAGGCTGTAGATYTFGMAGCFSYGGLSAVPGYAKGNYTVTAGTCSVTGQPQPSGGVTGTGPTTVCCK